MGTEKIYERTNYFNKFWNILAWFLLLIIPFSFLGLEFNHYTNSIISPYLKKWEAQQGNYFQENTYAFKKNNIKVDIKKIGSDKEIFQTPEYSIEIHEVSDLYQGKKPDYLTHETKGVIIAPDKSSKLKLEDKKQSITGNKRMNYERYTLKGSGIVHTILIGETNDVSISGNWTFPKFIKTYAGKSESKETDKNEFTETWNSAHTDFDYITYYNYTITLLLPKENSKLLLSLLDSGLFSIFWLFMCILLLESNANNLFKFQEWKYFIIGMSVFFFYECLLLLSRFMIFNLAYILSLIIIMILTVLFLYYVGCRRNLNYTIRISCMLIIMYTTIFLANKAPYYGFEFTIIGLCSGFLPAIFVNPLKIDKDTSP